MKITLKPGDTPYEFAGVLNARFQELARQGISPQLGVVIVEEVQSLMDTIVSTSYNPTQTNATPDLVLLSLWRGVRWRLYWLMILEKWQAFQNRMRVLAMGMEIHHDRNDQEE